VAGSRIFVDTNVLLYAHDQQEGRKREIAKPIVADLVRTGRGALSTQILQELYVNVTRKARLPPAEARELVRDYATWHVESIDVSRILHAADLSERHTISFRDGLIIAAAAAAGAEKILTEDLQHGQTIDGVRIENPFAAARA
jgi:predicted nucleic acid-binding protein